jgi:DNA-binding LacI/PurR family transcriptional regulator
VSATINDVAKRAGVSPKTVSNVINVRPHVREETRSRVLQAVAELGYHPDIAARSMVTKRRNLIGFMLWDILNPAYTEMVEIIVAKARDAGYMVILGNVARDPTEEEQLATLLIERRVDGAILASTSKDSDVPNRLMAAGVPVVLVSRYSDNSSADYVGVDNQGGGYLVTQHLLRVGHERIAFIRGAESASTSRDREAGYRSALEDHGIQYEPALVAEGGYTSRGAYEATHRLLTLRGRPTALVCANDVMAISAIDAVCDAGLRVPEDVAVTGFDDIAMAGSRCLGLTTVRAEMNRMAREAVNLLLSRMHGPLIETPRRVVFPAELVVRRTCGASLGGPNPNPFLVGRGRGQVRSEREEVEF